MSGASRFLSRKTLVTFSIILGVVLFAFLVPVVGQVHSSPMIPTGSTPPNEPWPRWYASISYALIGTGVVVGGNGVWCWRTANYPTTC